MGNYLPVSIYGTSRQNEDSSSVTPHEPACNELLEVSRQWQALYQSAEYQTSAALMVLDSKDALSPRKQTTTGAKLAKSQKNSNVNKLYMKEKKILREQLKGLRKTHDGMKILVNSLMKDQYVEDIQEYDDSNREIEALKQTVEKFKGEIDSLHEDKDKLQQENMALKRQLKDRGIRTDQNNLSDEINPMDVGEMEYTVSETECIQILVRKKKERGLIEKLANALRTRFEAESKTLDVNIVEQHSDVKPNVPLLVLCINASRLGTDVDSALKDLNVNKQLGLLVLHPKALHTPATEPSEKLLSKSVKIKRPVKIFDMAFLPESGIYNCDENDKAIYDIADFIKSNKA